MSDREPLDPELAGVVDEIADEGVPPWHAMSINAARRVEDELFSAGPTPAVGGVRDLGIEGPDGDDLPIRVYVPGSGDVGGDADDDETGPGTAGDDPPILLFYHGGLWAMGTLDSDDDLCRILANGVGAVVVSVDYRLAPEHPFPAAVEDAHAALEWARAHGASIGGNPERIGVAGTSAGATLAAATALFDAGDRDGLAVQALLYPVTDYRFDTDSYRRNADGPLLTRTDVRYYFDRYLRSPVDAHHPFATPLRAREQRLRDVAPAVVVTAGHDPLRDDGREYADRLEAAGGDVDHRDYPWACHGFLSLTRDLERAHEAFDEVAGAIRDSLF